MDALTENNFRCVTAESALNCQGQELSSGRSDFSHENLDFTEPPLTRTVYDEEAHGAIDSMLLEALRKSPISANTWNDPTIFPIVNEMPTKSTVGGNVYTVLYVSRKGSALLIDQRLYHELVHQKSQDFSADQTSIVSGDWRQAAVDIATSEV